MSIWMRIQQLFRPELQQPVTTLDEMPKPARPSTSVISFSGGDNDRAAIVRKCREMYRNDPRAKRMVRTLARDMVRGGFVVKTTNPLALEEAQHLQQRLNLDMLLDDWVRLSIRDGDSFLELGVDGALDIVEVTRKPVLEIGRACDEYDRFPDPEHAFWWTDEMWLGQGTPRTDDAGVTWFSLWQIIHARWDHDTGERYGTPMLASGRGHFKKVQEGELDVAIRRKTRSGMKYVHVIEGGDESDIEAYKEFNQDALNNPFAAVADFFTSKPGTIQAIQGDGMLGEMTDVKHQIATWMMSGETPMELLGYGENLNRDVLGEKKAEYDETLEQLREWVSDQLIKPLVERQWLMKGIYPKSVEYTIEWRAKQVLTPTMVKEAATAAMQLRLLGVTDEIVAGILARFLPGVEADSVFAPDETDRIADAADDLNGEGNDDGE